jgi:hypothetical protein
MLIIIVYLPWKGAWYVILRGLKHKHRKHEVLSLKAQCESLGSKFCTPLATTVDGQAVLCAMCSTIALDERRYLGLAPAFLRILLRRDTADIHGELLAPKRSVGEEAHCLHTRKQLSQPLSAFRLINMQRSDPTTTFFRACYPIDLVRSCGSRWKLKKALQSNDPSNRACQIAQDCGWSKPMACYLLF